jgi:hypothetical protein
MVQNIHVNHDAKLKNEQVSGPDRDPGLPRIGLFIGSDQRTVFIHQGFK